MNIKIYKFLSVATLLLVTTNHALAYNSHNYKFYFGLGLQRTFMQGRLSAGKVVVLNNTPVITTPTSIQPNQYKRFTDGGTVAAGFNLYNFGVEFGYNPYYNIYYPTLFFNSQFGSKTTGKQSGYNLYLDSIFYCQFYKNFVAKLHLGAGFLSTKYQVISDSATGGDGAPVVRGVANTNYWGTQASARIGVGIQWNFSEHWSTELYYMYQRGNELLRDLQSAAIGLNYYL